MWNWSLAVCFTMYLLQQIRPASRASADSCSYSSETRWTHSGDSPAETGLGVRLVLAVAVAASGSTPHLGTSVFYVRSLEPQKRKRKGL